LKEALKAELQRLVEIGMLVPSDSAWASELIVAPKKTFPFIRVCGNFPWINGCMKMPQEPIPVALEELMAKVKGFKIFADIDLKNAFHQFLLSIRTSNLLSIQTPNGLFRPRFLPEGVTPAPGVLQKHMREFLADFDDWLIVIFDNILVLGLDHDDLTMKIEKLFDRLIQHNVILKQEKSKFYVDKVEFFGYELTEKGFKLTDERLEALAKVPFPTDKKELQRFLGGMVFCAMFIPNYSQLTHDLNGMTRKDFNWDKSSWTKDYMAIFENVKKQILRACSLFYPDYSLPWILRTDASLTGIGAVLLQVKDGNIYQPIAFISKSLSETATRWPTIKAEAYGIYYACYKLQHWLYEKPFVIQTDHRNLVWMEQSQERTIVQMRLFLQSLPITGIAHISGKDNSTADLLSRLLYTVPPEVIDRLTVLVDEAPHDWFCKEYNMPTLQLLVMLEHYIYSDEKARDDAFIGSLANDKLPQQLCLLYTTDELLKLSHNAKVGHKGASATYKYLCKMFPGHRIPFKVVEEFVRTCATCMKGRLGYTSEVKAVTKTFAKGDYPRRMICR
jgi:hypothetical protein